MQVDPPAKDKSTNADVWELIQSLVLGHVPAERILELFYWAQLPGILEIARAFLDMGPDKRALMGGFFAAATDKMVLVEIDRSGRLILSCPTVTTPAPILREVENIETEMNHRDELSRSRKY